MMFDSIKKHRVSPMITKFNHPVLDHVTVKTSLEKLADSNSKRWLTYVSSTGGLSYEDIQKGEEIRSYFSSARTYLRGFINHKKAVSHYDTWCAG